MRRELNLNLDVLELVCDSVDDRSTVLSLSLGSRSLRTIAIKRLLMMKPVTLKDEQTVLAFHEFISADPKSRLPFLRALDIGITGHVNWIMHDHKAPPDVAHSIVDLLENVTHLTSLTLPYPRQTFAYLADPRISEAIIRISTLRELKMLQRCDTAEAIVRSTRSASSLRILHVSLYTLPTFGDHYSIKIAELDAFLCHLAPTLEVLDIAGGTVHLDVKGVEFSALRSLVTTTRIVGDNRRAIRMDYLVSKFPALDGTLSISTWVPDEPDLPNLQRIRASNAEQQKQRSWRHLDRVIANVLPLFALGLTCPVRHLLVDGIHSYTKSHIVEILRSTPPTHLKLSITLWFGGDVFQALFPPQVIPRLTHLVLLLEYSNSLRDDGRRFAATMQWRALLEEVIDSIRRLHLTHIRLFVHYDISLAHRAHVTRPYSKDLVRAIVDVDLEQLAEELINAVPSLRYVFLSMGGQFDVPVEEPGNPTFYTWEMRGRWFTHSAWKNDGGLKKVDEDAMERMLVDEDLMLSEYDNYSLGFHDTYDEDETAPWALPE